MEQTKINGLTASEIVDKLLRLVQKRCAPPKSPLWDFMIDYYISFDSRVYDAIRYITFNEDWLKGHLTKLNEENYTRIYDGYWCPYAPFSEIFKT